MSDTKVNTQAREVIGEANRVVNSDYPTTIEQSTEMRMQAAEVILRHLDSYDGSRDGVIQNNTILHSELAREVGLGSKEFKELMMNPDAPETLSVAEIRQNMKLYLEDVTADTLPSPPNRPIKNDRQESTNVEHQR